MPKPKLIDAAGYARRSTDLQERSIPDQKAYLEAWAKEHGYRIVRWFIDDAISGTSTRGRDDFDRMIDAAENGRDFETILCYDISRFSRGGTNETGYYLHRLKLVGVDVVFTADGIPEGDEGELIQGVKSWQARQYSVKLARDTIRGQISNIRERKSAPGGVAPYGYDKQHMTSDGTVLRTLRWMADGSKQQFGPDGKFLRVIEAGVNIKKARATSSASCRARPSAWPSSAACSICASRGTDAITSPRCSTPRGSHRRAGRIGTRPASPSCCGTRSTRGPSRGTGIRWVRCSRWMATGC